MNIFDLIIQMEKNGESFYRNLANQTHNKGFQTIFNQLADEEIVHQRIFSELQSGIPVKQTQGSPYRDYNIFEELKKDSIADADASQLHLYQQALETEKKSYELYLNEASKTDDPELKSLFERVAKEEEQHYLMMHNLVELMLRPQTWVENGEFVHLEDY